MTQTVLLVLDDPGDDWLALVRAREMESLKVVAFSPLTIERTAPAPWNVVPAGEYLDVDALRVDFLAFLSRVPQQRMPDGRTFEEVFRRPEGDSIWWTSLGADRHPDREPFLSLRALWVCDRVLAAHSAAPLVVYTKRPVLAAALAERCRRENRPCEIATGSAAPAIDPWSGRRRWWLDTLKWVLITPFVFLARALLCRWAAPPRRETAAERAAPAILFSGAFPLDVTIEHGRMSLCWWRELSAAVAQIAPRARQRFLLETMTGAHKGERSISNLYHTGWPTLSRSPDIAPMQDRYAALGSWLSALPRQIALMRKLARLEQEATFRDQFTFAGMNVAAIFVPRLRRTVARVAGWSRSVAAIVRSMRGVANVRVLVLVDEVYERGMLNVSAARRLAIPTVGMQHGTIFPLHMIYTPPPGQIAAAPTPTAFAVYGQFAEEILCDVGSVPRDRVWQTGSPRFDPLVAAPRDRDAARERLNLPRDRRIILLATQLYPWFPRAARALFRAVAGRGDCFVCLKTHPKDVPLAVYEAIAAEEGAANVRCFADGFDELLAACDVLASGSSTTVFEAILLGRDTICLNFSDEPDRYPYVADGGSLGARSDAEVVAAVERVLNGAVHDDLQQGRERFIARHAAPCATGHAAEEFARRLSAWLNVG